MKGDKGRKKTWFKLGHERLGATETHHTNQVNTENHYIRLPRDQHDALIEEYNDVLSISDVDGKPCNVKLLQPKPAPPTYIERLCEPHGEDGKVRGLWFVQAEKFEQLWQNAIQGHSKSEPTCTGTLELDKDGERQVGLYWQERIKCNTCGYLSEREKLYNEVDRGRRGRKIAAPNLAVQVGLAHPPMANTGLQTLLHSLDVPSPSTSTLQSRGNFVNQKLVEVNKEDMKMRRGILKKINRLKGLPEDSPIRVEGAARYNNPLCENVTSDKDIISVATHNKICQTSALQAQRKGGIQKCVTENHEGECTATITAQQSIGNEYHWATDCLEELLEDNITVKYFTTDCDSRADAAAGDCYKRHQKEHSPPRHLKDTQHVGHGWKIINTTFSHAMFPGRLAVHKQNLNSVLLMMLWKDVLWNTRRPTQGITVMTLN